MPIARLEFNLDNPDDADAHRLALHGRRWASLVGQFDNDVLRNIDRGKTECPWATGLDAVAAIRAQLYKMVADAGLDMEDAL